MEGTLRDDLREQLAEREAEHVDLRDRLKQTQRDLEQAQTAIDRLSEENEQLRQELKSAGRCKTQGHSKRKAKLIGRGASRDKDRLLSAAPRPPRRLVSRRWKDT